MADRKTGHLIENAISFRYDRVILTDMRTRGYPAMTSEQFIEAAGSKRMATSFIRRGLIVETGDGFLKPSKAAQRFAEMWHARESKKARVAEGIVDVVVGHPADGRRTVAVFHARTTLGKILIEMHPSTATKTPIDNELVPEIVSHMRNDGAIVDNRVRPSYRGARPTQLVEEAAAAL